MDRNEAQQGIDRLTQLDQEILLFMRKCGDGEKLYLEIFTDLHT
jgi:hypothetical protein